MLSNQKGGVICQIVIYQCKGGEKSDFFEYLGRWAEEEIWTKPLPSAYS